LSAEPARAPLPPRLAETVELLETLERGERIDALISIAGRFRDVPERIARRPFAEARRVPACESEAFVFVEERGDGTLDYHFAVENPQGISAKALAVLLAEGLSGAPLEQVAAVPAELVERVFGRELSMGKSMGLAGMVQMARREAGRRLAEAPR
jgi:cysteine desulfuration protein SufE